MHRDRSFSLLGFSFPYWMLCTIEMFERLAYFALRSVVAVYIMQADEPGGLHLTAAHKGSIYAWWFVFQSILPMFTGGIADRYGYKKVLFGAITANIAGYVLMGYMRSYEGFFFAVMLLATGTAFFKPALQGSLAQSVDENNSSMGWGIFYWVVNVGAVIGPLIAAPIRGYSWQWLFFASAAVTSLNYLVLLTFKDIPSGANKTETAWEVLHKTLRNIVEPRLIAWLLIMSCFWLMMYQLWDLHPNFITDWIDSSAIANNLLWIPAGWLERGPNGDQLKQEILLAENAALIVLLMIPISWLVRRMRTLEAMTWGMVMAVGGVIVAGMTGNGWIFLAGVLFFSLGEMLTGPKKQEYLGLIAPPGKKGLYLGYVNIPVGIGGFAGSKLAGYLYGHFGDKSVLAQKYLLQHTSAGEGKHWNGDPNALGDLVGADRTEAMVTLQQTLGLDASETTRLLWETYNPQWWVWTPIAAIGALAAVALLIYGHMAKRWTDMNA